MERTLFQLTQAICAYRIGVVHALPQYGRTTIIQTLAQVNFRCCCCFELIADKNDFNVSFFKLCGTNCANIFCNSSTKVDQIENFHRGLIASNSWCLFKNIHRLSMGNEFLHLILINFLFSFFFFLCVCVFVQLSIYEEIDYDLPKLFFSFETVIDQIH